MPPFLHLMEKMKMRYIAIDTETWLITKENSIPKGVCASTHEEREGSALYTFEDFEKVFLGYLKDDEITLLAHNAKFDFGVLAFSYTEEIFGLINLKYSKGLIICTQLHEVLCRLGYDGSIADGEKSLAFCAEKYLDLDLSSVKEDGWRLRYNELDGLPISEYPKEASEYAKEDARICLDVFAHQVDRHTLVEDVCIQGHVDWLCNILSSQPLTLDMPYLDAKLEEYEEIIKQADEILVEAGFKQRKFKTKDPQLLKKNTKVIKALVEEIYTEKGLDVPKTDKGAIQIGSEVLKEIEGHNVGIDTLIALGQTEKCVTTYLRPWKESGNVMPRYNVLVRSGRMASFQPNIQNVPRNGGIRGCIIPRDGNVFCSIDYSQLELCSLAQVIKEMLPAIPHKLLEAINSGKDLHCLTGSSILGITYDEMMIGMAEGWKECKDARQMAKAANFGLPGGLGKKTFIDYAKASYGVIVPEDRVKAVFDGYFAAFPDVRAYLDFIPELVTHTKNGSYYECKQLFTDRVRMVDESHYCSACNTGFQGLAGDGIKRAIKATFTACWFNKKAIVYGCEPIAIIHDEIIFEIPDDKDLSRKANFLSLLMENEMSTLLKDVTAIKAEPALMRRWLKEAEPAYDKAGNLIVWEEKHEVEATKGS